ncbi:LOW QUALITY PROTEIN: protein vestigial-like isoform X2, partial [Vespula maculifrons]
DQERVEEPSGGGIRTGGATFGYASRQAGSGVPSPGGVMSCSEVMYQYYHPYLYSRAPPPPHPTHPHAAPHTNPHAAHHSPARPAPFQPFSSATATHQYDRHMLNAPRVYQSFGILVFLIILLTALEVSTQSKNPSICSEDSISVDIGAYFSKTAFPACQINANERKESNRAENLDVKRSLWAGIIIQKCIAWGTCIALRVQAGALRQSIVTEIRSNIVTPKGVDVKVSRRILKFSRRIA